MSRRPRSVKWEQLSSQNSPLCAPAQVAATFPPTLPSATTRLCPWFLFQPHPCAMCCDGGGPWRRQRGTKPDAFECWRYRLIKHCQSCDGFSVSTLVIPDWRCIVKVFECCKTSLLIMDQRTKLGEVCQHLLCVAAGASTFFSSVNGKQKVLVFYILLIQINVWHCKDSYLKSSLLLHSFHLLNLVHLVSKLQLIYSSGQPFKNDLC